MPAVRLLILNVALPFMTFEVYFTPSISTVAFPVAFSGTFTVMTVSSPTPPGTVMISIGASYLGPVTIELNVALEYLSSPLYISSCVLPIGRGS